jgi:hypothetical protein
MRSLEKIDRWIAGKIKQWTSRLAGSAQSPELLEIRRDILEEIRDAIEPAGQGRNIFPYRAVSIGIAAMDAHQAARYQAAFVESGALERDIRDLLAEAGCAPPAIAISIAEAPAMASAGRPFEVAYSTAKTEPKPAGASRPAARLIVVRGQADPPRYEIRSDRVNIGRLKEVVGDRDGLRRRNDIAFADSETSVSREHAYIRYDRDSGHFRLYDSRSQRGTCVFREGRRLKAPGGSASGLRLQSGDEIHLGDARLLFELEDS